MSGEVLQTADAMATNPCKFCLYCKQKPMFSGASEFKRHLRRTHCSQEGGSFVCQYGRNNVCPSLPLEGVNEIDYLSHVEKMHIGLDGRVQKPKTMENSELKPLKRTSSSLVVRYRDDQLRCNDTKTGWTQFPCQNLSAVLNDPQQRKRETDLFTRVWGEDFVPHDVVPLTLLPNTPRSYFSDYWHKHEMKYLQHVRLKRAVLAPHSGNSKKDLVKDNSTEQIPEVFFHQDFNLEKIDTFNEVLPWSQVQTKGSATPRTGKLLQERLGHYLDITEVKLAQQIATKSADFFQAMNSQDKLQSDVKQSCLDVQQLRVRLSETCNDVVRGPLNVMRQLRLRKRYEVIEDKMKLMSTIHQTQPTIQLLLASSDFVSALDLIETSLEVLQQELVGIQCFRHLGSQLTEMRRVIEQMMIADFLSNAVAILNQPHSDGGDMPAVEEERLFSTVLGLLRQRKKFLQAYKVEAFQVIKSTVKKAAHDYIDSAREKSSGADDQGKKFGDFIRSLEHDEWLVVLEAVFCVVLHVLKNMKVIHEALMSVFSLASGLTDESTALRDEGFLDKEDFVRLSKESKELLWSACELAQTRCSKVIMMRAKDGALDQLASKDFVTLARMVEHFSAECETITGRQSQNLRSTLLSQAKLFVEKFHEQRKTNLSSILDIERWRQVDVPNEIQQLVDSFPDGNESPVKKAENKNYCSYLTVQGQRFVVVGTLLMLLKMVAEYCQCVGDVPMLALDLLTKLCEVLKISLVLKTVSRMRTILLLFCLNLLLVNRCSSIRTVGFSNELTELSHVSFVTRENSLLYSLGNILRNSSVKSAEACQLQCLFNTGCTSVNVGFVDYSIQCQLLVDADIYRNKSLVIANATGWQHFSVRSEACEGITQCHNNQTCIPDYNNLRNQTILCVCDQSFFGSLCQWGPVRRLWGTVILSGPTRPGSLSMDGNNAIDVQSICSLTEIGDQELIYLKVDLEHSMAIHHVNIYWYKETNSISKIQVSVGDDENIIMNPECQPLTGFPISSNVCKLFNSRTCQIVLGAGALQTIGLKTITAKHLALVAQCLEVVILHMHVVRNHFEARIPTKQFVLLSQFDQILKDYGNHRHEVLSKIINLMDGIFKSNLTQYEIRAPMPSQDMRAMVKHIVKLRETMATVLNEQQQETLFRDIRRCFKTCFAERLSQLKIEPDGGPQHGLVTSDLSFFLSNLKCYPGFKDLTYKFDDLWKTVKEMRTKNKKAKHQPVR